MLRMCVSTVFVLRNSSPAISPLRLAVDDQPGDLEFARGERPDAGLIGVSGSRSAMDPPPEPAQLLLGLVAIAPGAAAIQLGGRLLE